MKILRLILAIAISWGQIYFVPYFERALFRLFGEMNIFVCYKQFAPSMATCYNYVRATKNSFFNKDRSASWRFIRTFCISLVVNSHLKSQQYLELFFKWSHKYSYLCLPKEVNKYIFNWCMLHPRLSTILGKGEKRYPKRIIKHFSFILRCDFLTTIFITHIR